MFFQKAKIYQFGKRFICYIVYLFWFFSLFILSIFYFLSILASIYYPLPLEPGIFLVLFSAFLGVKVFSSFLLCQVGGSASRT